MLTRWGERDRGSFCLATSGLSRGTTSDGNLVKSLKGILKLDSFRGEPACVCVCVCNMCVCVMTKTLTRCVGLSCARDVKFVYFTCEKKCFYMLLQ